MARYTGPKDRQSRREGIDLNGKGAKLTRIMVPPGVHGPKGKGRVSQYGRQLRAKQAVKRMYGVYEKQFAKYVNEAFKMRGNTGNVLMSLLERRLDNVVYRLGFAPSRSAARQLVGHRHVLVDGKKINIPSYQIKMGQSVTLTAKALEIPYIKDMVSRKDYKTPGWLKKKAVVGNVQKIPTADDITEPISIQEIIEFYSR